MCNVPADDWTVDCLIWRHRILTGKFSHWCADWDDLPIDETCPEWPCGCVIDEVAEQEPEVTP